MFIYELKYSNEKDEELYKSIIKKKTIENFSKDDIDIMIKLIKKYNISQIDISIKKHEYDADYIFVDTIFVNKSDDAKNIQKAFNDKIKEVIENKFSDFDINNINLNVAIMIYSMLDLLEDYYNKYERKGIAKKDGFARYISRKLCIPYKSYMNIIYEIECKILEEDDEEYEEED